MSKFDTDTFTAIANAVELEEGRLPAKKRLAILSAVDCFAQHGYQGTSTKMIAENAEIAEATIFRHFGTKDQLLMRIAEPIVKHLLAPAVALEANTLQTHHENNLRDIARSIIKSRVTFLTLYKPLVKIMLQEILVNEALRDMLIRQALPVVQKVSANLLHANVAGVDFDERHLRSVISLVVGYVVQKSLFQPERDWDDDEEVEYIVALLFNEASK